MGNAKIKTEKTYTLTANGREFPGWRKVEVWNGFAKMERDINSTAGNSISARKETAIIQDDSESFCLSAVNEIFGNPTDTIVHRSNCGELIEACKAQQA